MLIARSVTYGKPVKLPADATVDSAQVIVREAMQRVIDQEQTKFQPSDRIWPALTLLVFLSSIATFFFK